VGDRFLEIADRVVAARTLFGAKDFCTVVRVLNLTERPYGLKQDQFLGSASWVEVIDTELPFSGGGDGPSSQMAARQVIEMDVGHVQCLIDGLPTELTREQREQAIQYFPKCRSFLEVRV